MTYQELLLYVVAFNCLESKFRNDDSHFAMLDGMVVMANHNYPAYYFKNNIWLPILIKADNSSCEES